MSRPKKILVATDFSSPARVALDEATDLTRLFDGELHIVHVFALPTPLITAYEFGIPEPDLEQARGVARAKLDEAAATVSGQGVSAQTHLLQSPADTAIAEPPRPSTRSESEARFPWHPNEHDSSTNPWPPWSHSCAATRRESTAPSRSSKSCTTSSRH